MSKRINRPICVALTGQIAAGKSTALKSFEKAGYRVYSADQMVHEIYEREGIDRADLALRVKANPKVMKALEKKIHPMIRNLIRQRIKQSKTPLAIEVPLLFEAKLAKLFDVVVVILAPLKDRQKRVMKRGTSKALFKTLDRRQWSGAKKAKGGDIVIWNLEKKFFKKSVEQLAHLLKKKNLIAEVLFEY